MSRLAAYASASPCYTTASTRAQTPARDRPALETRVYRVLAASFGRQSAPLVAGRVN